MGSPEAVDKVEIVVISGDCNSCDWSGVASFTNMGEPHMDQMISSTKADLRQTHRDESPNCNGQISFSI